MNNLFKFLAAPAGRWVQGIAGSACVMLALFWMDTTHGAIVGMLGLVLLADAVFDICLAAPLCGMPFQGLYLRKEILRRQLRPQSRTSNNHLFHR
jgi:hypothetical protein